MTGKRGKGRGRSQGRPTAARKVPMVLDDSESESDATPTEPQIGLRQRWELASVLNFLKVFKELIGHNLKMSAEEIETALIKANDDLALIHTSLLKGIPPVSKNLMHGDAWVTELGKTVAPWWPRVAEGEYPLAAEKGEEAMRYKALDPTTRLLILKALCEVRALQDDVSRYINDGRENGAPITAFRKERIGDEIDGVTYWYDGDQVLGYRLYKETAKVESSQKNKEKGCLAQPIPESSWETLATNLKEFKKISDNLMSSKCSTEAAVLEIVKTEIIPVLEKFEKKKSQTIKGRGLQRDDFQNSSGTGTRHSRRLQKLRKNTVDDCGRNIEASLQTLSESDNLDNSEVRRSRRACFNDGNVFGDEGMKKRPRLRATSPTNGSVVISDSDDESSNEGESSTSGSWERMNEPSSTWEESSISGSSVNGSVNDESVSSSDGGSSDGEEDDESDSSSDSGTSDGEE